MDSSPPGGNIQLPPVAGVKRPAPGPLLPAFEPLSSSPSFPRSFKRVARASPSANDTRATKYPTPMPSSSTGIIPSSPPHLSVSVPRPFLQRTQSSISERVPLSAVPSVTLSRDGEPLLMGRSSNSSHYQLSANRLISRVHVRATYIPSTSHEPNKIQIVCLGWNGVKVHCQGKAWELSKGDTFTSETEQADLMLDVQDARVLLLWPPPERKDSSSVSGFSDSTWTWDDENSPRRNIAAAQAAQANRLQGSPLRRGQLLSSPISPTPASNLPIPSSPPQLDPFERSKDTIQVYEDEEDPTGQDAGTGAEDDTQPMGVTATAIENTQGASQPSDLSDLQDFSDQDEENDPIIHSFGPQGDNLLPRMASFTATDSCDERRQHQPLEPLSESPAGRKSSESTVEAGLENVTNHVINQLAFSRLSSTPLSVLLQNLPTKMRGGSPSDTENAHLSKGDLRKLLEATPCIGEVTREGKDAAGKPLESEFYYIPELDPNERRKETVVEGLGKPGLRACRKQHKQYYWRKPK